MLHGFATKPALNVIFSVEKKQKRRQLSAAAAHSITAKQGTQFLAVTKLNYFASKITLILKHS